MSTTPPVPPHGTPHMAKNDDKEIRIVSHSNLFYWWPVWAVGFLMTILTYWDGHRMAFVPAETKAYRNATVQRKTNTEQITEEGRDVLVAPANTHLPPAKDLSVAPDNPRVHMSYNKSYGVVFFIVLLLVIVITNVPLRGLWSFMVLIVIMFLTIIFWILELWEPILDRLAQLHIHMNAAGYLLFSLGLFVIWLVTFILFDPQVYMIFTPGQLRVCTEIGGGLAAHDTAGMVIMKQRNDLFRHWILGMGSGDLIVNTSGASAAHYDLPNVLFVGYKVKMIEEMLREKAVVPGQ
jgi:hypothetical protein